MTKKPSRVGEPVQVYLNDRDRALLDKLSDRAALPRSEILRVALRRLASDLPGATKVGMALPALIGALDDATDVPADLAARHDEYLYALPVAKRKVGERKAGRSRK
ncbi:MAG: ribbon-helix-helix protein, CopG family [Gemmatimonadetes bacterium]|nr:ribbon-helix-helix protein, CopG family [Gemmatimonadota bacterium]